MMLVRGGATCVVHEYGFTEPAQLPLASPSDVQLVARNLFINNRKYRLMIKRVFSVLVCTNMRKHATGRVAIVINS